MVALGVTSLGWKSTMKFPFHFRSRVSTSTDLHRRVSGYFNQASIQAEIMAGLVELLRNGEYTSQVGKAESVVLVGHSFGSFTSANVLTKYPSHVDAAILTGIAYSNVPWPENTPRGFCSAHRHTTVLLLLQRSRYRLSYICRHLRACEYIFQGRF
jgi:pimeloyl-ACP methyl ester carboxylesterase